MATVVTNAGRAIVTNRIKGSGTEPNYIGWGTGTTTADDADTALETESSESRVSGTSTQQTTTVTSDTYQVAGTITSAGSQTISEVALFDAATSGNCFLRGDFSGVSLNGSESIAFQIKAVFA